MKKCDVNKRHQNFKRELRAYHDSINRKNPYNLAKIAGKLNVFESDDNEEREYSVERKIPNTGLTVLKMGDFYAIGNIDGVPLTEFKYQFIEGSLGEHNKIVRCILDDGKIEDFDVNTETILENAGCAVSGIGISDVGCSTCGEQSDCGGKDYTEIDYSNVEKQLMIPFLCGARVDDIKNRKRRKVKRRKSIR